MRPWIFLLAVAAAAQTVPGPYAPEARAARLEGTANAWVEIDRDGKVLDAGLLQGLGMGLDNQAVEAVRNAKFSPGAPGITGVDVVYSLPDGPHWRIARLVHRFNVTHRQADPTTHQAPTLTNPVLRQYTRPDDRACTAGTATSVHFVLDANGVPANVDTPTALRSWRFDPARRNGVAVPVTTEVLLKCGVPPSDEIPAIRVGPTVTPPRLLHKTDPLYSEPARMASLQGTVLLSVDIGPDGYAEHLRVVRPLGHGLDVQALDAVRQWTFEPGRRDGGPVSVRANIEVNFRLL